MIPTMSLLLPHIEPLVSQLVRRFQPRRIILFGSYAYGTPHEESDLDLLLVISDPPSRQKAWKIATELSHSSPVPLQLVFMRPEEFEETKEIVGGLAYPAYQEGKILHEASS
jgi:predicted nucleotidyltransferase